MPLSRFLACLRISPLSKEKKCFLGVLKIKRFHPLISRHECFTGIYTTRKIHTRPHPGLEWRILHILTSEDIDDVIPHFFSVVCANSQFVCILKRTSQCLEDMDFIFLRLKQYFSTQ